MRLHEIFKTLISASLCAVIGPSVCFGEDFTTSTIINLPGSRILYADLATADFNGDGYKEIVAAGADSNLHVITTSDGRNWRVVATINCNAYIEAAGPPTRRSFNAIAAPPAIADLDRNGTLEIVVTVGREVASDPATDTNGGVLVFTYTSPWNFNLIQGLSADGSQGWPQPRIDQIGKHPGASNPDGFWDAIITSPALADLDGDGDLEIVVAGIDRRIHAWHHTGQVVAGWPIYRYNGDAMTRSGISSPAIGDIDRDGLPEVIVATQSPYWDQSQPVSATNPNYATATIWAWNGDSSVVPGFPIITDQWIHSSPALADIDRDGYLEIVIGGGYGLTSGKENSVTIYNHDGSRAANWPQLTKGKTPASPTLADIDRDGSLEVLAGCGTRYWPDDCGDGTSMLYAWNADGSAVSGFPTTVESASWFKNGISESMPFSPIVADVDGDGQQEILMSQTGSWGVTVVGGNGALEGKRTIDIDQHGLFQAPIVDDIDNDGHLELLAGGGDTQKGMIFIWDEEGMASTPPWPMSRLSLLRSATSKRDMALSVPSEGNSLPYILSILLH